VFHAAGLRVRYGLLDGGWVDVTALHLSSLTRVAFLTLIFYSLLLPYIFCRFIVKRLCPLFVGGAVQIAFD